MSIVIGLLKGVWKSIFILFFLVNFIFSKCGCKLELFIVVMCVCFFGFNFERVVILFRVN